jgi:hypothetical protein
MWATLRGGRGGANSRVVIGLLNDETEAEAEAEESSWDCCCLDLVFEELVFGGLLLGVT